MGGSGWWGGWVRVDVNAMLGYKIQDTRFKKFYFMSVKINK